MMKKRTTLLIALVLLGVGSLIFALTHTEGIRSFFSPPPPPSAKTTPSTNAVIAPPVSPNTTVTPSIAETKKEPKHVKKHLHKKRKFRKHKRHHSKRKHRHTTQPVIETSDPLSSTPQPEVSSPAVPTAPLTSAAPSAPVRVEVVATPPVVVETPKTPPVVEPEKPVRKPEKPPLEVKSVVTDVQVFTKNQWVDVQGLAHLDTLLGQYMIGVGNRSESFSLTRATVLLNLLPDINAEVGFMYGSLGVGVDYLRNSKLQTGLYLYDFQKGRIEWNFRVNLTPSVDLMFGIHSNLAKPQNQDISTGLRLHF